MPCQASQPLLLARMPKLLSPWHNPVWLQFVSHKVARLLFPYFLVLLFVANLFALNGPYLWLLCLQSAWYMLALSGSLRSHRTAAATNPRAVAATQRESGYE